MFSIKRLYSVKDFPAEYAAWADAKNRCINPKNPRYKFYGEKGITMYLPWTEGFIGFQRFMLEIGPKPNPKFFLDRKRNSQGYHPGNVHWVHPSDSAYNRNNSLADQLEKTRYSTLD